MSNEKQAGYRSHTDPRPPQKTTYRRYGKLNLAVDCAPHSILAAVADQGPRADGPHFGQLLDASLRKASVDTVLADAGYDSEPHHRHARTQRQVRSVIPARVGRKSDKPPSGYWRRQMRQQLATPERRRHRGYGQRWPIETVFSQIKRCLASEIAGRSFFSRCRDLRLLAVTHNLLLPSLSKVFYRAGLSPIRRPIRRVYPQYGGSIPNTAGLSPIRRVYPQYGGSIPNTAGLSPIRRVYPQYGGSIPNTAGLSPIRRVLSPIRRVYPQYGGSIPNTAGLSPLCY